MTYFVVRAGISQQQSVERILKLDADELRVQVVESDTGVVVGAVLGADFEVRVHRLRHAGVGRGAEHRRLGDRADLLETYRPRGGTLLKLDKLQQLQQQQQQIDYLVRHSGAVPSRLC